jgi:multiple sugar transport system permease protein
MSAPTIDKPRRFSPGKPLLYLLLILVTLTTVFPFYWMISGSFMRPVELFSRSPHLFPSAPELTAYRRIFELVPLPRYFINSLVVSLSTTVIAVLVSSAAGYCFAQLDFIGKGFWFAVTLATLMVPYHARMVPLFTMFTNYRLNNTYLGIVLPGMVSALGIFLMTQFFKTIPREVREAALMDGASELRVFFQIYLPLARPAVATLALFVFMGSWDDLLWPMIIAPKPEMRTLQVGLAFIRQQAPLQNQVMAAIVLSVIPVVVAFLIAQRQFISGITAGAIKE